MPPCTSANTFVLCVRGKRKWMRAGCWGFWACVILLTRIQIHRRRALSPQSAHHIKAPGFAGLQTERFFFFFPPLICFPSSQWGQVFHSCEEYTKESTIITAVIDHYRFSPIRALVNHRTKSLPKQPACPGANNGAARRASLYQQLVNWILWHTVKFTVFSAALPLSSSQQSPQTDPEAQQHLALPLLIMGKRPV